MRRRGRGRTVRSAGGFVVLVGPDGVGKTSTAASLIRQFEGPTHYFHFRPSAKGGNEPDPGHVTLRAARRQPGRMESFMRLGVNVFRFWLGYLATIKPVLRRGGLVVGDRWAYGYLVQPEVLRYTGPRNAALWALRLMPTPDLVAVLVAPPEEIHQRKPELTVKEIEAQLAAWAQIPGATEIIDARRPPEAVAGSIMDYLLRS